YNVNSNRWNTLPPMLVSRSSHASIYQNNHLYVVGGMDDKSYMSSVNKLDLKSGEWSPLPSLPKPLQAPYVAFVSNQLFVIEGFNGSISLDVQEYDSRQSAWSARRAMPERCVGG
ncbi:hypothetical protein CAPTEDRAFT_76787, partial [Capitella teleta]